jgi:hypothetical protein
LEATPTTIAGIATVLEVMGSDAYYDETPEPGATFLGWAYNGDFRAEEANNLMLRLAETLRRLAGEGVGTLRTAAVAG